jgi:hypothetical protein
MKQTNRQQSTTRTRPWLAIVFAGVGLIAMLLTVSAYTGTFPGRARPATIAPDSQNNSPAPASPTARSAATTGSFGQTDSLNFFDRKPGRTLEDALFVNRNQKSDATLKVSAQAPEIRVLKPKELRLTKAHSFDGDLRDLPKVRPVKRERPEREGPEKEFRVYEPGFVESQISVPTEIAAPIKPAAPAPTPLINFAGLDFATWGAGHPPDTNGDVGPTYYIQSVNTSIGIYNKSTGAQVTAFTFDTFMSQGSFGNLCDTDNFGDPVVLYDSFEDRWIISDFAFTVNVSGDVINPPGAFQCFAASKTNDPVAGGWNFYSINTTGGLGDYPKFGIWPDGLYLSVNMFDYPAAGNFQNVRVYAFNKMQMYAGASSVQSVSFDLPSDQFTVLPANARLQTGTPPANSANYMASISNFLNAMELWKFKVDWNSISLSTVTGPFLSTMTFWWEQFDRGGGVTTAPTTANANDTLYPRLMMQNQYTNIGGVEAVWNSHTVGAGNPTSNLTSTQSAVRYYQVNVTGGTVAATTAQSFTYSPDATMYRYMPSAAVDRAGNMAIGYTTSNAATNPALKYAGRLAGDAANTILQTEQLLFQGTGSQSGSCGGTCERWGDYSAMSLDPDGCTFWYTNEYYAVTGLNDLTRIGSFRLPGCTAVGAGGTVSGTVTDSATTNPISGATVSLGSRTATTNGSGFYSFTSIPAGTYPSISATAPGYNTVTINTIVVTDGGTNTKNFALTAAANNGCFVDTSQADFLLGVGTNVDLTTVAGSVRLASPTVIDQQQTTDNGNGYGFSSTSFVGQTFTPAVTGTLQKLDVYIFCASCSGTDPNMTAEVRTTTGGNPVMTAGGLLASATVAGTSSGAGAYFSFSFGAPPTLTSGTQYGFVMRLVSNRTTGIQAVLDSGADVYAGGRRKVCTTASCGNPTGMGSNSDVVFKTYMNAGFATSGNLVSSLKDANPATGFSAEWTTLSWTNVALPANTTLQFQAAGSNSSTGPFNFVGPDGTAATFFTVSGASLSQFNGFRYLKYKAYLATTNTANTPTLNDVTVCFNSNNLVYNANGNLPPGSYNNVTVNGPAVVTQTGNVSVAGCLTINNGGVLNMGTFTLSGGGCFNLVAGGTLGMGDANGITTGVTASGNIQVTGGRTYSTAANYTYNGSTAQVNGNGLPATVNNLTAANSAGLTLSQNVTVGGVLTLTNNLTTGASIVTQSGTSAGAADVIGNVRRTDLTAAAKAFGNPFNTIAVTAGSVPANITVNLVDGSPGDFANAVRRVYTITPSAGGFTGTLQLHYNDTELNGNSEATLDLWRSNGATWSDQGATTRNSSNNFVQLTGVTTFSPWALSSSGNAPTAVKLSKFVAVSYADGVQLNWESGFEVNNLGYHVYREENGKRSRVTSSLIAGSALSVGQGNKLTAGYSYGWFDPEGTAATSYWLEAIDLNGSRAETGPIYPATSQEKNLSPRRERAMLLGELASTAKANGAANRGLSNNGSKGWPAAQRPSSWTTSSSKMKLSSLITQQTIANGPAVKIAVKGSGWHRVTRAELAATGFDLSGDSRLLQLFVDGEQVPIRLSNEGPQFNANDTLEFFAVGLDTPTTGTRVYYLIRGTSAGMRVTTRKPRGKDSYESWTPIAAVRSFDYTTERREKLIYASHVLNGDADNIFGAPIFSEPLNQDLNVRNFDRDATAQPQLEVSLQGLTAQQHEVQVQFNGSPVGTLSFAEAEHPTAKFSVNRALIREGDNTVSLVATNGSADISFVDSLRLTYAHRYTADNNALWFSAPGNEIARVDGFTTPNIRVIDVTNPAAPVEFLTTGTPSGSGYAVKVPANGNGTRTLLAFADDLVTSAASVTANQPSNWHAATNGADLLIITHKDFRQSIEPLANQRRNEGMSVAVVDVEDVFDEYSYGAHTPAALKAFLAHVAISWSRKPAYLLLVGDSTWDPRNYLGEGDSDFVPTKLIDTGYMETASDDWLVDFVGTGEAGMAVGRLPGRTSTEADLMVAKILAYQRERDLSVPLRGAVMVADSGFESHSASTSSLLPAGISVEAINRSEVGSDDVMKGEIVDALNQGPMIVNYYGHGSVRVWTGAGVLDADLAAALTNVNKPSFYVLMTCLNGYASDAYVDSLGESALKSQNGAVAVWASSGFTDSQPQFLMNQEFYRLLFGTEPLRLGEATRRAKGAIGDQDVRRTWMLFGDPTMRLR